MHRILLCSDLDRTILPNGPEPESPVARPLLSRLAKRSHIILAYVSGRSRSLLKEAIRTYDLPMPDYAIGDVGTTIYEPLQNWHSWTDWTDEISQSWRGRNRKDLEGLLSDLPMIRLQEPEKQNTLKLSYYTDLPVDEVALKNRIQECFSREGIRSSIIFSIDEQTRTGLVDILPDQATKLEAIRFLMRKKNFADERTVFAGDSGNDLPVLTSGLQAVLVKNASTAVRQQAVHTMAEKGLLKKLYLAQGNFFGMNGNYSAGLLEGLAHFLPETLDWLSADSDSP